MWPWLWHTQKITVAKVDEKNFLEKIIDDGIVRVNSHKKERNKN